MIESILSDLRQRFAAIVGKVVGGIVMLLIILFCLKWAWAQIFGTDTSRLEDRIENQTQVINQLETINKEEAANHALQIKVEKEAKDDLVEHIEKKAETAKIFEAIKTDAVAQLIPKKPAVKKAAKPVPPKAASSVAPEPPAEVEDTITAEEIQRQQHNAKVLQDALWKAYEQASLPQAA